jgi:hypothetical protein
MCGRMSRTEGQLNVCIVITKQERTMGLPRTPARSVSSKVHDKVDGTRKEQNSSRIGSISSRRQMFRASSARFCRETTKLTVLNSLKVQKEVKMGEKETIT